MLTGLINGDDLDKYHVSIAVDGRDADVSQDVPRHSRITLTQAMQLLRHAHAFYSAAAPPR